MDPGDSAATLYGGRPWLQLNNVYHYREDLYAACLEQDARVPRWPYFLIETAYEGEHKATPDRIRRQAYWPLLSGACGILYGNSPVWHFGSRGVYDRGGDWVAALNSRGAQDMARLAAIFRGRPWWQLRPDRDHKVVTAGYGTLGKLDYIVTARSSDGTLALSYLAGTGTASRELTVDLSQLTGPVAAHWLNPTDGRLTPLAGSPYTNLGPRQIQSPGDNGTGANDWLLILETAAGPGTRADTGPSGPSTNRFDEKSIQQWTREQPLGETPKRLTEDLPLSDQENRGRWVKFEPMWDEFDGSALDSNKWTVGMSWWQGRPPAWFNPTNVVVRDGQLHLTMRKEAVPKELASRGYHDYTSAALHTKARSSYGFYEVKARAMNSAGSSSFWFQQEDHQANPGWSSEIDVFELCGKSATHDQRYYMTVHVFDTPQERRHWQVGSLWRAPWRFAEQFHVYGFEWGRDQLRWYVDGQFVRTVQNTHWHQPLYLIFDSETMPDWFGMPEDADLPSTFSIEYVRAWKHQD